MKRESDTIGGRSINRPMTLVNLPNSQRSRECQTVRCTAHLSCGRDNKHVANLAQGLLQHLQTVRVDAVVIRNQNARHLLLVQDQRHRRTRALIRGTGTSLLVVNNRVSSWESATRT